MEVIMRRGLENRRVGLKFDPGFDLLIRVLD